MSTQSRNHPRKGSTLIIEPFRTLEEVERIKAVVANHPRNYAILSLGINSNLRAGDLLSLRNSDINWERGEIRLKEQKTGKKRHIPVARKIIKLLEFLRIEDDPDALIFRSEKTGGMLDVSTLNQMVKSWARKANLKGNYGSHSLRKTFCRIHWEYHKTPIEILSQMLNHSSLRTTYRYMGVVPEDHKKIYLQEI